MANNYRFHANVSFGKVVFISFLMVMVGTTLYFSNYLIKQHQSLQAGAAGGKADLFFEPSSITVDPNGNTNLWVTTDKQLIFLATQLTFDKTKLKLSQEITLPNPSLKRVIKKSTMAEANSSGTISLVLAVDPIDAANAPTGSFSFAGLKFTSLTTSTNVATNLSITSGKLQLIDIGGTPFSLTSKNADITINPATSTQVIQPSLAPAASITPMASTAPVSGTGPQINVKSPKPGESIHSPGSNGGLWIGDTATDEDGIYQTNFYLDGRLVWTCGRQATCNHTVREEFSAGNHVVTVESMDNSPARNKTVVKLNVTN